MSSQEKKINKEKSASSKKDADKSSVKSVKTKKTKEKSKKEESQDEKEMIQQQHVHLNQQQQQFEEIKSEQIKQVGQQNMVYNQPQVANNQQIHIDDQLAMLQFQRRDDGPKLCMHHQLQFAFFCETCEEPICQQCTILGPHNNQLHRVNRLQDAYKLRTMKIQEQIKLNLLTKREQLLAQIHRIEYRIEEIKYVKTIIERDARSEYSSILERLKQGEGSKLALLHHEIAELQKDLDQINDVGSLYYDLTGTEDICPFLLRSRQIYENIEYLVAKPFKIQIDVYPYDLPRELTELRLHLQKAVAQKHLLEFKNEIIWKLITEKRKDEEQLRNELEKQAAHEINEWSKLVDRFSLELKRYQLVCYYCGVLMEKEQVNKKCSVNKQNFNEEKIYGTEQPPEDQVGTERHYFCQPIQDDE